MLEVRFGRCAQGRGDQQTEQVFARHLLAIAADGFSRENAADCFVVFDTLAHEATVAEAPRDQVRIGRHHQLPTGLTPQELA